MAQHTTDKNVLGHIEELVTEEKKLYAQGDMSDAETRAPGEDQRRARPLLGSSAPAAGVA